MSGAKQTRNSGLSNENIAKAQASLGRRRGFALPRLDTYGGKMEPYSEESYADYALRKLEEQVILVPESWKGPLRRAVVR